MGKLEGETLNISNILVTGRMIQTLEHLLGGKVDKEFRFLPEAEVTQEDLMWAEGYVGFNPTENFQFLQLKWVHSLGAGVDSFILNMNRTWPGNVILTKTIAPFGSQISEYCLSYMLTDLQQHTAFQNLKVERKWLQLAPRNLKDLKVVVFGTGSIGSELARTLKFFGTQVIGVSQSGQPRPFFDTVLTFEGCKGLLESADWIISTLPLTLQTCGFFNHQVFDLFNSAVFVNVGRGKTVCEKALLVALSKGNLRKAILDVFEEEPLTEESELWDHPKVIITPHISALTDPEVAATCMLETLKALESGSPLENRVDIQKSY